MHLYLTKSDVIGENFATGLEKKGLRIGSILNEVLRLNVHALYWCC